MAYAIIHHFPGGTKANYEASIAAVHPGAGKLPEGQIFHASGPVPGGSKFPKFDRRLTHRRFPSASDCAISTLLQ